MILCMKQIQMQIASERSFSQKFERIKARVDKDKRKIANVNKGRKQIHFYIKKKIIHAIMC